ncbi:MAG: XRE family transcriptional regulator [Chitinophagaceae bacterium]|nr:MAG: XRE family transcriptional regulator [Chitinophagaceae bacterium]
MLRTGSNIKKIRTAKNLSQQAFADLFELTRGNISSYEENRAEPKLETVIKIANYFCIPLNKFVSDTLSVNEVLQYEGDLLLEDENRIINLQLREVPFISDNVFMRGVRNELAFEDVSGFPKLVLPETSNNNLLGVSFNNNIPHHQSLPDYRMNDVLVFEELTRENVHLCDGKPGLYVAGPEIMIGQYEVSGTRIELVLNDFKKHAFDFGIVRRFWKLFAVYSHEKA